MSLKDHHIAIMEILLPLTKSKERPYITYGEMSRQLEQQGIIIEAISLRIPLYDISTFCMDNGAPALSVFVVSTDTLMPGDGFYIFFTAKATLTFDEKFELFMNEQKRALEYREWPRIAKMVGINFPTENQ